LKRTKSKTTPTKNIKKTRAQSRLKLKQRRMNDTDIKSTSGTFSASSSDRCMGKKEKHYHHFQEHLHNYQQLLMSLPTS
jgi:hypothetical protein